MARKRRSVAAPGAWRSGSTRRRARRGPAVLGAWGYDGVELGGFFDHATVERYPDKASRRS